MILITNSEQDGTTPTLYEYPITFNNETLDRADEAGKRILAVHNIVHTLPHSDRIVLLPPPHSPPDTAADVHNTARHIVVLPDSEDGVHTSRLAAAAAAVIVAAHTAAAAELANESDRQSRPPPGA